MKGPRQAIIHVDQRNIRKNLKEGSNEPVMTVIAGGKTVKAQGIEIWDESGKVLLGQFIYSPDRPLSCGARLWFKANLQKTKLVLIPDNVETVRCGTDDIVVSNTLCQALKR